MLRALANAFILACFVGLTLWTGWAFIILYVNETVML